MICIQAKQAAKVRMTEVSDIELLLIDMAAVYVGISLPGWICSLATKQVQGTNNSKRNEKDETIQTIADFTEDLLQYLDSHHADSSHYSHDNSTGFDGGSCDGDGDGGGD